MSVSNIIGNTTNDVDAKKVPWANIVCNSLYVLHSIKTATIDAKTIDAKDGKFDNMTVVTALTVANKNVVGTTVKNASVTGTALVSEPSPSDYEIRRLRAGTGISFVEDPDYVEISSTGGGSTFNGFYVNSTAPPVDTYVEDSLSPMLFNNVIYNTGSLNWVPNTQTNNVAQFDTILITCRIFIKTMGYENITLQIKDVANPIGDNLVISEIKSTTPPLTSVAINRYYEFAYTWRKLGPITGPVSISLLDLNGSDWVYQVNTSTYLCMTKL